MGKGLWAIAAAIAIGGSVITTSTSWATAPPTATAAPPPHAGSYVGHTSQGLRIMVRVARSRKVLSRAAFGFRVHCADRHTLWFLVSPILPRVPWRLNIAGGTGFTRAFHDTSGERYWIRGRFMESGTVRGTLSTSWDSPHDGMCRSGRIDWQATLGR